MKILKNGQIDFYDFFVGLPRENDPFPIKKEDLPKYNTKFTKKERAQYKYGFQYGNKWINGGWTKAKWEKVNCIRPDSLNYDPVDHEVEHYFDPIPAGVEDKEAYLEAQHKCYAIYLEDQDYIDHGVEIPKKPKMPWET